MSVKAHPGRKATDTNMGEPHVNLDDMETRRTLYPLPPGEP